MRWNHLIIFNHKHHSTLPTHQLFFPSTPKQPSFDREAPNPGKLWPSNPTNFLHKPPTFDW